MFKTIVTLSLFALSSAPAFAAACPDLVLECELKKLNDKYAPETVLKKAAAYVGVNADEPWQNPNRCEAMVTFTAEETGQGVAYQAEAYDDLTFFMYVSENYKTRDPQFMLKVEVRQDLTLYHGTQQMVCRVKSAHPVGD